MVVLIIVGVAVGDYRFGNRKGAANLVVQQLLQTPSALLVCVDHGQDSLYCQCSPPCSRRISRDFQAPAGPQRRVFQVG